MANKSIIALLIGATIAMTLFSPVSTAVTSNTGTQTVTNETATATVDQFVDLEGYDAGTSETVYYDSGSGWTTAAEGSDYEWDSDSASVKALSGGNISDGDSLRVSYTYQATSGSSTTVITLVPLFMALLVLGVMAAKVTDMV